jgi:hypothetical protein
MLLPEVQGLKMCENGGEFYWAEGRLLWVSVQ